MKITYLLHVLTFLHCLVGKSALDYQSLVDIQSLVDLCPHTNYCTNNATKGLLDTAETPCCASCSCADDCWKRGNCCVDKQTPVTKQPTESCEPITANQSANEEFDNKLPRYYVTKRCPTANDPLEEKCSGRLRSLFSDFVWVTDNRTQRIYNNKHCARCHGVTAYTPWSITTNCIEAFNGRNSPIDAIYQMLSNCRWSVVPPSSDNNTGRCLIPEIAQCNVTGNTKAYDPAIESACNSFTQIYLEETIVGGVVYRTRAYQNAFCFLCNAKPNQPVADVCTSYGDWLGRTGKPTFTGMIDFTAVENVEKAVAKEAQRPGPVCAIDEIKDPHEIEDTHWIRLAEAAEAVLRLGCSNLYPQSLFGAKVGCLKLSCPIKQAPVYGRCIEFISNTRFLLLSASFRLYPKWNRINNAFDVSKSLKSKYAIESIAEKLILKVRRGLGLSGGKNKICEESLYGIYDGEGVPEMFSTYVMFYTSENHQEDAIIDRMASFVQNEVKILIGEDKMAFTAIAAPAHEFDANFRNTSATFKMAPGYCPKGGKPTDLRSFNRCTSVDLNREKYLSMMEQAEDTEQKRAINALFKFESMATDVVSTGDDFTVQVCYESYRSVLSETVLPGKNSAVGAFPKMTLLLIGGLIFNICINLEK